MFEWDANGTLMTQIQRIHTNYYIKNISSVRLKLIMSYLRHYYELFIFYIYHNIVAPRLFKSRQGRQYGSRILFNQNLEPRRVRHYINISDS